MTADMGGCKNGDSSTGLHHQGWGISDWEKIYG